jgi:uncharacterized protein YjeT (DUF2065 family)
VQENRRYGFLPILFYKCRNWVRLKLLNYPGIFNFDAKALVRISSKGEVGSLTSAQSDHYSPPPAIYIGCQNRHAHGLWQKRRKAAPQLMTYPTYISLKLVTIIIGLLVAIGHLPPALAPERVGAFMKTLPRNYPLGIVLMLAATLWFTALTGLMDLGELSGMRTSLMTVWSISGVLVVIFVPGFLAARGLGCLLLLAAALILDSAFLVQTPARFVMTIMAYVWVIWGMVLVYSPHLWRNVIDFATQTPERLRLLSWPGVAFGLFLIGLALYAFPS